MEDTGGSGLAGLERERSAWSKRCNKGGPCEDAEEKWLREDEDGIVKMVVMRMEAAIQNDDVIAGILWEEKAVGMAKQNSMRCRMSGCLRSGVCWMHIEKLAIEKKGKETGEKRARVMIWEAGRMNWDQESDEVCWK